MQCLITNTVISSSGVSKPLLICNLLLSFYFLPLTLPNIFISSLLPSDISIALLLPRRLRGELEHMCVSRSVFMQSGARVSVLWMHSLHVTLRGPNRCRLNGYEWSCE